MDPPSDQLADLHRLVSALAPQVPAKEKNDLEDYCLEVLNSQLHPSLSPDLSHLSDEIQKALLRRPAASTSSSASATALRFSHLLGRLRSLPAPKDKFGVIYFLHTLAQQQQEGGSGARSAFLVGGSGFLASLGGKADRGDGREVEPSADGGSGGNGKGKDKELVGMGVAEGELGGQRVGAKGSMKERLRHWRTQRGAGQVPESDLLRDVIFVLQGIDGKYVRFRDTTSQDRRRSPRINGFTPDDDDILEEEEQLVEGGIRIVEENGLHVLQPTRDLLHRLAELGWLYRKVEQGIRENKASMSAGMIQQSLCHALQHELSEYYRLIAVLESQMAQSTSIPAEDRTHDAGEAAKLSRDLSERTELTLKRLVIWTEEARLRMRMMGVLVEGCMDVRGGALVSLIHSYTSHGDPFIRKFTDNLLEEVSRPFFSSLAKWIYDGELLDPYDEFFVELNPEMKGLDFIRTGPLAGAFGEGLGGGMGADESLDELGFPGHRLWEEKFGFRKEMLPSFVSESFGRKIFSTGKSLNFIKYNCQDSDWVVTRNRLNNAGRVLRYNDIAGLERSIDAAYTIASQRLFDIFFDKFKLMDHLRALKDYLMLGKGDFVEILMESLGPSLSKPANTLYRHDLTASLETARQKSTSVNDSPDTFRRLDARMHEYSRGEIGWDVFTLEYKVDSPVDTIIDPNANIMYMKMFNHLWRLKRVELALSEGWREIMIGARQFSRLGELKSDFHRTRVALSEMIHFVRQLTYYNHLEVIGCTWVMFEEKAMKKEGDLDSLIEAHRTYLERLVSKTLMLGVRGDDSLLVKVREIFRVILQFREAMDALCNYALKEAARREIERDAQRGLDYKGTGPPPNLPPPDPAVLDGIRQRLTSYASTFTETVTAMVRSLAVHQDLDVRFLSVRLNHNLYYLIGGKRKK